MEAFYVFLDENGLELLIKRKSRENGRFVAFLTYDGRLARFVRGPVIPAFGEAGEVMSPYAYSYLHGQGTDELTATRDLARMIAERTIRMELRKNTPKGPHIVIDVPRFAF